MMILAGEGEEEEVLLGLCVVVVSLAFLFANALVFGWLFVDLKYVDDWGGCARGTWTIFTKPVKITCTHV
jgi:hypothetical protein